MPPRNEALSPGRKPVPSASSFIVSDPGPAGVAVERLESLAERTITVRNTALKNLVLPLLVVAALTGARPCLGGDLSDNPYKALERAREVMQKVDDRLASLEMRLQWERANVQRLKEDFDRGQDPAVVARALKAAGIRLDLPNAFPT